MLSVILSWISVLAPLEPHSRTDTVAAAIQSATVADPDARRMAATLTVISFAETCLGRSGVAFGACGHLCRHHCGTCHTEPLADTAAWSAGVIRRGLRLSGGNWRAALRYYHAGTTNGWRSDHFSLMEARIVERLLSNER